MAHRSRLAGFIIDCRTDDLEAAAGFWAAALGDRKRRKPQGKYVKLDPQAGLHVEVQKVEHASRVHLDIESDDIPAEVARLERLGAKVVGEGADLGGDGGADRAALLRDPGADRRLRREGDHLGGRGVIYREAGDFKTSYAADGQTFPLALRPAGAYWALMAVAFLVVPLVVTPYWANAMLLPFLIWSIAALGLNILTGYCGQLSLGTGGFMAVGAFAAFKLMTAFPGLSILLAVLAAGAITALVGMAFGLPSLRIKGFYLAVATLAAQFFLVWLFNKVPWFFNHSATGQINAPVRTVLGFEVTGAAATPAAKYLFCLGAHGGAGLGGAQPDPRADRAGLDGDPRHGHRRRDHRGDPLRAKLSAFAVSSFFVGVAGALYFAVYFGAVEVTDAFGIRVSFLVLFMVIIGGLGLDLRQLRRRGVHGADADPAEEPHGRRPRLADRPRGARRDDAARRAHHVLPDRRAARAGAALAAGQGEAAALAVSALSDK